MLLIAESMPATSEMVPLIEIYLTIVMALTSMSIVLTVYVLQLHHSGPVVLPIPHTFKYSLVRHIAPLVGMKKIVQKYAEEHHLIDKDQVYRIFAKPPSKTMDSPLINNKNQTNVQYPHGNFIFTEGKKNEPNSSRNVLEETADEDDDEDLTAAKIYLDPISSNGNLLSSSQKRSLNHPRSHLSQIVLIPEQTPSYSSSSSPALPSYFHAHYELFNSNMHLLQRHLKRLIKKQKLEEDRQEVINEWKLMALIMDRFLFWLFASLTILSTVLCLIVIPCLKNAGYIPALDKDLRTELQTVKDILEEQLRMNLTNV